MNKKVLIGVIVAVVIVAAAAVGYRLANPEGSSNQPGSNVNTNTGLANPASSYCVENGGRVEIRTAADGSQSGACVFADGTSCEEWAYYRGTCMPLQQQAGGTRPADDSGIIDEVSGEAIVLRLATDAQLGNYLIASNGLTLYTYSADTVGVSNCAGQCSVNWPVYVAPEGVKLVAAEGITGTVSTIVRADDVLQVTYNGMPLYFWKGDEKPGDIAGQGVNGTWTVAKP